MSTLALEAETTHSTSEQPLNAHPCGAAGCPQGRDTSLQLLIGGRPTEVPLCTEHASRWRGATL
jgi:hypothetical protein